MPKPTSGIVGSKNLEGFVNNISMDGKLIGRFRVERSTCFVNISYLSDGMYYFSYIAETGRFTKKM